jgi:hypothetical protein
LFALLETATKRPLSTLYATLSEPQHIVESRAEEFRALDHEVPVVVKAAAGAFPPTATTKGSVGAAAAHAIKSKRTARGIGQKIKQPRTINSSQNAAVLPADDRV